MTSDTEHTLGFLVHTVGRLLRKRLEQMAIDTHLSAAQWRLLFWVAKEEGTTQARIAEFLEIEPISVSRMLDRMEQGGWVERRADVNDRRVRAIFLTDLGREAFVYVKSFVGEVTQEAFAGISKSDQKIIMQGLERVIENLNNTITSSQDVEDGTEAKTLESAHQ